MTFRWSGWITLCSARWTQHQEVAGLTLTQCTVECGSWKSTYVLLSPSSIAWWCGLGGKQVHRAIAPCPWSCSFGWCLDEGQGINVINPMSDWLWKDFLLCLPQCVYWCIAVSDRSNSLKLLSHWSGSGDRATKCMGGSRNLGFRLKY